MRKLLDVTDTRTRLLQQGLAAVCGFLAVAGARTLVTASAPVPVGIGITASALLLLVAAAGIKQRWEIEYRGHHIRFENSLVTAERLYLDEGLVARGGLGAMLELRAPLRVGDGAGETIVALVNAGQLRFRVRLFAEGESVATEPPSARVAPATSGVSAYEAAVPDERPVTRSAVLGRLILAKDVFEVMAGIAGLLSALGAALVWLF